MSKNLNIFLLRNNASNFKTYLKNECKKKVRRHYIDKENMVGNIEKGIIFINEEILPLPEWVSYLNTISEKNSIKVSQNRRSKAVLFLTIKGMQKRTFAITFGNGSTLLDSDYIIPDFGAKVSKSLLSTDRIISIDSTSIDRKIFNTKKQSMEFLIPEKLLEFDTQSIVRNVYGIYKDEELKEKFSLGGNNSLKFKGSIDLLKDLEKWLNKFATLYSEEEDNLGLSGELAIASKEEQRILDNIIGKKILDIVNTDPLTRRQISTIKIIPNEVFDTTNFDGFFISGLGYKNSKVSSDFLIDTLNFFERFKRQLKPKNKNIEGILQKIKSGKIHRKDEEGELHQVCSIYKAINFETTLRTKKYILVSGTWYEIDREFYSKLKSDIDGVQHPDDTIQFINFNSNIHYKCVKKDNKDVPQASEGKYNENLAEENRILMLDRKDYSVDKKTMDRYGLKNQSSIEICDVLYFNKNKIQFVHVKRHSGASGTSHLLTQALVSAHVFIYDQTNVIKHINEKIKQFNTQSISYKIKEDLVFKEQRKEIIFAIIEKKENVQRSRNNNSKLLSLLEMISLRQNVRTLEYMGFDCYLKFIPADD